MNVHDSGLDDCNPIIGIDRQDAVHSLKLDDDPALHRHRAATQTSACSPRNKRNAVFIGYANDLRDLFGRPGENDNIRLVFEEGESVAFVNEQVGFILSNGRNAKNLSKSGYDFFLHFWFSCSLTIRICSLTIVISG